MAGAGVFGLRYAHAFASVAASAHLDVTAAKAQMQDFAGTLSGSHDLREALMNPSIPSEQKLAVIDALAERMGMMREVRNFIAVIMDHQRLGELNDILAAYDQVADANAGMTDAEITSAHGLNEDDRRELEAQVARLAGTAVRVEYRQDAALLGGAVVKIGSKVYDGSVRAQLQQMKQTLVNA
jgi:F-type H+-transporting ATPase subunit delta